MTENRTRARRALACAVVFAVSAATPLAARAADDDGLDWSPRTLSAYESCIAKTETDPDTAYEDGLIFQDAGGGVLARHCIALALLELGHTEEAAARLEDAAFMPDGGGSELRAELLSQAGNAWLLAEAPYEAERAFNHALTAVSGDPDLFIDRARALAMQNRFEDAVRDLDVALSIRPRDPLALRLKADALLEMRRFDEAMEAVNAALEIVPDDIPTLLVRGHIREAIRLAGG